MRFLLASTLLLAFVFGTLARPSQEKRLIQVSETVAPKWLTEDEVFGLIRNNVNFMDITDHPVQSAKVSSNFAYPEIIRFQAIVQSVFPKLNILRMETFVSTFATYRNRYYTTATGAESSDWLFAQVNEAVASSGYTGEVSVTQYTHSWLQKSVIARIEGADPTLKSEVIVLGAHLDSVNSGSPSAGVAPGADDDGSGCIVLLESLRGLLESGFIPKRTIEFQWYAAEEVGLRGSQDIANAYINQNVNVIAMIQFDVVGYSRGKRTVAFITDYTNPALTQFLRIVTDAFLSYDWENQTCGYGCSDHASYHRVGFPASYPSEVDLHPRMHTTGDTFDTVNFEQVLEFTKLAVGAIVELAEPHRL